MTVNGDGGFLMNCQELETAVRLRTPFVNVIWENSQFGSIVWKQDKKFGRHFGVDFTNPDFVQARPSPSGCPPGAASRSRTSGGTCRTRSTLDVPSLIVLPIDYSIDVAISEELGDGDGGDMSTATVNEQQSIVDRVPKQLYIGGEWRDATGGGTLAGRGPRDRGDARRGRRRDARGRAWPRSTRPSTRRREWAATPPRERGEILRRAYELLIERADDLALLMTLEMGKPVAESKAEIVYAAEFFRWFAGEALRIDGHYKRHRQRHRPRASSCSSPSGRA